MDQKKIPSKIIPHIIKQMRESKGLSQGQLSKKTGIEPQRISKYERGVICPTADMLVKISDALEVSLDYLILGEDLKVNQIGNRELLKRFKNVSRLPEDEQLTLIKVIDAFLRKEELKK